MRPAHRLDPVWMLAPSIALLLLFFFYPLLIAFLQSFHEWDLLTPPRYVGTENYRRLLADGAFTGVLSTTLLVSTVVVAGAVLLGLGLALVLNREGRLAAFVRASVFSAYVVSWVSVGLLWLWLLDADAGLVAGIAHRLGVGQLSLLTNPRSAPFALACVMIWKVAGYAMVLFLGGLQSIPPSVLEAALLDGTSRAARLWHVTLPLLAPTTAFVATTSLILTFQAFDVVRVMTQGGPVRSTTVFVYSIYEQMFMNLSVGRASAEVIVFFVVLLALTSLEMLVFRLRGAL